MENPNDSVARMPENSSGLNGRTVENQVKKANWKLIIFLAFFIFLIIFVILIVYAVSRQRVFFDFIVGPTPPLATGTNLQTTGSVNTTVIATNPEPTGNVDQATIQVYLFDRNKFDLPDNTDYVSKVTRMTARKDIGTFAIEEIIKGPTAAELGTGLAATFGQGNLVWFTGNSKCAGKDFTLSIAAKKATVQFCKSTAVSGDMSGGIIGQQIVNTLKQFSTVDQVRILDVNGACFDDMKGVSADECWE